MSLLDSLSIASSGLLAVQGQINVVSQNVANANTAGYVDEQAAASEVGIGNDPGGVRLGNATRITAPALQSSLWAQNAKLSSAETLNSAWSGIVAALGATDSTTGSAGSITASLTALQSSFTTLQANPSSSTAQFAVVSAAQGVASGINAIAATLGQYRQNAETSIGSDLATANQALAAIGAASTQIMRLKAAGQSTASLEDQRDAAMTTLSNVVDVVFTESANGDMLVRTRSGTLLPTDPTQGSLSISPTTLGPTSSYPANVPGVMLSGIDVTASLTGGTLGANLALRDSAIPTASAELDGLAAGIAQRFNAQGLALFADAAGNVPGTATTAPPPSGQVGYAAAMQVAPSVSASPGQTASGSGANAASFSLSNILDYAFGTQSSAGVAQPGLPVTGLGPAGNLTASYQGSGSIFDLASQLTGAWGASAQQASTDVTNETATQSSLTNAIADVSGVSIDSELSKMVALQNSYTANAKIIAAVQSMFTDLLNAVTPA